MNAVKFKVVIRKDKLSKTTNEVPVCLRITKNRKIMYRTLTYIKPEHWDEKNQCVRKNHRNSELLNATITKQRAVIEQEVCILTLGNDSVDIGTIRNKINDRTSFDLFEYSKKYLEQLFNEGKYATYKKNKSVTRKLKNYIGKETLPIKSITVDFIKEYEMYLSKELVNSKNTIAVNMKSLAKLVNDIFINYHLDSSDNPFKQLKFKQEHTNRTFLEIDDIRKIIDFKLKLNSPLYDARELFVFECFTGIRISDILTLRWKNVTDKEITITMRKTGKPISIPIQNDVKSILRKRRFVVKKYEGEVSPEKYVFNILKINVDEVSPQDALNAISSATAIINKQLKKVGEKAGIQKILTTHVGRHSFATLLITADANLMVVRDLLGHRDIRVTQTYTNVVDSKKQEAINELNNL